MSKLDPFRTGVRMFAPLRWRDWAITVVHGLLQHVDHQCQCGQALHSCVLL